jgi:cell division protein FtsQ
MWKQRIIQAIWITLGVGTIVLLVAAVQKKQNKACKNVEINITGASEHVFVDEKEVMQILNSKGQMIGRKIDVVSLRNLEAALEKDQWIANAELFFDNNQVLNVTVEEREPIARVFAFNGNSFYLDTAAMRLPLSDKLSAKVPVFTSFPYDKAIPDSSLLRDMIALSKYIKADSFWMAQIAQIDILPNKEFEMIPVIGNHTIQFGDVTEMDTKFKKLFTFYKQVSAKVGFDKYEKLNLVYDGQIVATKRGAIKPAADSAMALQQVNNSLATEPVVDSTSH